MTRGLSLSGVVSGKSHVWALDRPRIGIGRSSDNAIQLLDETVSREQAEILADGKTWLLRDLGGKNVTRANGVPVRDPVPLQIGDRLAFGRVLLSVTDGTTTIDAALSDSKTLATSLQIPAAEVLRRGPSREAGRPGVVGALGAVGGLLVLRSPLAETCDQMLRMIEEAVPASRLILLVRAQPDAPPQQMAARCRGECSAEPLLLSRTILSAVLEGGSSVITTDAVADPRFRDRGSVIALQTHSAMAVPLFENGTIRGLLYVDQDDPTVHYDASDLEILTLFGNMIAVKVANDHLVEAEQNLLKLEHELDLAGKIQRDLLPTGAPAIPGYECHALIQSCEEVGGDLYDFHPMPDGSVYLVVGDVSGKGIAAALLMAHFLALADALYELCEDPAALATRLNALTAPRLAEEGLFVTAFIGRLAPSTGLLRYANAGHPPGMLISDGCVRELPGTGPPCGAVPDFVYPGETTRVPPGGLLALYTDGIPETKRGEEEYFEVSRLRQLLVEEGQCRPLARLSERVLGEVDAFLQGNPRQDDVTLLLLRSR